LKLLFESVVKLVEAGEGARIAGLQSNLFSGNSRPSAVQRYVENGSDINGAHSFAARMFYRARENRTDAAQAIPVPGSFHREAVLSEFLYNVIAIFEQRNPALNLN